MTFKRLRELQDLPLNYHTDSQDITADLEVNGLIHLDGIITATLTTATGLIAYLTEASRPYDLISQWATPDYYNEEPITYTCPTCAEPWTTAELNAILKNNDDWIVLVQSAHECPFCYEGELF